MFLQIIGLLFAVFGGIVSIIFWIPGVINKQSLREIMGGYYGLIYFIYFTNGPFLLFIGLLFLFYLGK
ncbi:MAG: hypothetical protein ACLFV2_05230 [Desulfurivibrionaceae bacterium]